MQLLHWVLGVASLAVLVLVGGRVRRVLQGGFNMQYFLYTRTPVGRWYHGKALARGAAAAAHSGVKRTEFESFSVWSVPYLADNYAHVVVDRASGEAAVVDPADADAVERAVAAIRAETAGALNLTTVLTTHDHMDHAGGNAALLRAYPRLRVYGGADDDVQACNHPLRAAGDGRVVSLTLGRLNVDVVRFLRPAYARRRRLV